MTPKSPGHGYQLALLRVVGPSCWMLFTLRLGTLHVKKMALLGTDSRS